MTLGALVKISLQERINLERSETERLVCLHRVTSVAAL